MSTMTDQNAMSEPPMTAGGQGPGQGAALRIFLGGCRLSPEQSGTLDVGCLIELDCPAEGPAELHADGKLVARGEAVTVDGKVGLWVRERIDLE